MTATPTAQRLLGEARAEAKKHLATAELKLLQPLECREELRKVRQALRSGKND
jgi:hypothetical protein